MAKKEASQTEIAEILGLTTRQIRNLEGEGMPHRAEGNRKLYPLPGAVQWYYQREIARAMPTDFEEAKARKMAAEAALAELELAQAEGRIVTVDDMEKMLSSPLYRLRAKMLSLPSKWAPSLVGCRTVAEAQTRLEAAVEEAMLALAETGEEADGDEDEAKRAA